MEWFFQPAPGAARSRRCLFCPSTEGADSYKGCLFIACSILLFLHSSALLDTDREVQEEHPCVPGSFSTSVSLCWARWMAAAPQPQLLPELPLRIYSPRFPRDFLPTSSFICLCVSRRGTARFLVSSVSKHCCRFSKSRGQVRQWGHIPAVGQADFDLGREKKLSLSISFPSFIRLYQQQLKQAGICCLIALTNNLISHHLKNDPHFSRLCN